MKKIIYLFLIIILLSACNINNKEKDDYYSFINEKKINNKKLSEDKYTWSVFSDKQEKVNKRRDKIINDLINTNPQINILHKKILNKDKEDGLTIINKYINLVNSSKNIEEYIDNITTIENKLGIDFITNINIAKDFKNSKQNIIYLYPITMDFGTSADYYINEDYMAYKALIKQYGIKLLKEYGYEKNKAREVSQKITNMYIDISSSSYLSKDLEDISKYYNIKTKDDLKQIYTNIDIEKYLKKRNITVDKFSIVDENNYKKINNYLTNDNLYLLKEAAKLKILQTYALFLNNNYSNIIYELNDKITNTQSNNEEIDKANDIISSYFSYEIDKQYQNTYSTLKEKEYLTKMTKEIIKQYEKEIKSINWLSKKTKDKALTKLKNIKINVGLPDNYEDCSKKYIIKDNYSLIENIISINEAEKECELSKLTNPKEEIALSQTTVNAYYNPEDNSINFPLASFTLFNIDNNYYENLGSIGMIIAHEITHAFDSNGSKFDEYGNMNNWWTKEDLVNFQKKQAKVIKYYDKYEVVKGLHIDGRKTVNENIADLGAINCISQIAQNKKASTKEIKKMYTSFAKLWASIEKEEYTKLLLLQDTHSPNKYRVNATLSSTELFYKTYNINYLNKMYIKKEERVKVW